MVWKNAPAREPSSDDNPELPDRGSASPIHHKAIVTLVFIFARLTSLQNPVIDWSKYPPPPRAPGSYQIRNLPPIVGKLRRQILLDISVAFGVGMTMGYLFWYGYHVPAVRRRDIYYERLERERTSKYGGIVFISEMLMKYHHLMMRMRSKLDRSSPWIMSYCRLNSKNIPLSPTGFCPILL